MDWDRRGEVWQSLDSADCTLFSLCGTDSSVSSSLINAFSLARETSCNWGVGRHRKNAKVHKLYKVFTAGDTWEIFTTVNTPTGHARRDFRGGPATRGWTPHSAQRMRLIARGRDKRPLGVLLKERVMQSVARVRAARASLVCHRCHEHVAVRACGVWHVLAPELGDRSAALPHERRIGDRASKPSSSMAVGPFEAVKRLPSRSAERWRCIGIGSLNGMWRLSCCSMTAPQQVQTTSRDVGLCSKIASCSQRAHTIICEK